MGITQYEAKQKAILQIMRAVEKYHKTGKDQLIKIKMAEPIYIDAIKYCNDRFYNEGDASGNGNVGIKYTIVNNKNKKYIKLSYDYTNIEDVDPEKEKLKKYGIDDPTDVEW